MIVRLHSAQSDLRDRGTDTDKLLKDLTTEKKRTESKAEGDRDEAPSFAVQSHLKEFV